VAVGVAAGEADEGFLRIELESARHRQLLDGRLVPLDPALVDLPLQRHRVNHGVGPARLPAEGGHVDLHVFVAVRVQAVFHGHGVHPSAWNNAIPGPGG